jgi:DNA-binding Lrp family transcriptional regulator
VDRLDLLILRSLARNANLPVQSNVRKSVESIAKELGVDEGTVRNRLKRQRETGFVREFHVTFNPGAIGLNDCMLRLDVFPPLTKESAIRKIRLVEGVYRVRSYLGSTLGVEMLYDDDESLKRKVELISRIANSENVVRVRIPDPLVRDFGFKKADLDIVECIQDSTSKTYRVISKETGLSTKTVRRRLDRMQEARVLALMFDLDYRMLRGAIRANLLVLYERGADWAKVGEAVRSVVGDRVLTPFVHREYAWFPLYLSNLSERNEIHKAVTRMDGVKAAYLDLVEENFLVISTFKGLLSRMRTRVEASPTKSTTEARVLVRRRRR